MRLASLRTRAARLVAERPWRLLPAPDLRVVAVVLLMKIVLIGFGVAAFQVLSDRRLASAGEAFALWSRWDAPHYLYLAEHGYQAEGDQSVFLAFFPLFPWLVRLLQPLCGTFLTAALVLSTIASLPLAVLMRRLTERDHPGLGEPAVWFLFIFPTAYFLHVGYTESLFLALAVGAFLAVRSGRWALAGVLCALAALTRLNALVLLPALAAEAWLEYRQVRRWRPQWLWPLLTLGGVGVYLALNYWVGGHPLRFIEYQGEHWFRRPSWPWIGVQEAWRSQTWRGPSEAHLVGFEELFFVFLGFGATVYAWWRQRLSYAVWMTGNWLLSACQAYIFAVPRFSLLLFPMFMLMALSAKHRTAAALVTFWSLLFFGLFAGQFVRGFWAF